MVSTQNRNNHVQYPGFPQSLFFCEEDEMVLDYDSDTLKDFDLFSPTFSLEELMNEIPDELPPSVTTGGCGGGGDVKSVREDCMWAEGRLEEKLDIDVINNNNNKYPPHLQLVSPNAIISIKKDYFMRHLITSPNHLNYDDTNNDSFHDYNSNNSLESPTSSTFDSSDDAYSPVFDRPLNGNFFASNVDDTDEEIDVVGDEQQTTLTTEPPRSGTPETPTFEGTFNLTERNNIQCVLDTRFRSHHDNDIAASHHGNNVNTHQNPRRRAKRPRKISASKCVVKAEQLEGSSSEEAAAGGQQNEKTLDRTASHNHLEKRRRVNLKKKFDQLRSVLPLQSDRAAKVVILKEAIGECRHLHAKESLLVMEKRDVLIAHENLQNRINELQAKNSIILSHVEL